MAKSKTKKLITTSLLLTTAVATVATVIPFTVSNKEKRIDGDKNNMGSNTNIKYLFNNKYYDSIENISNELLVNNKLISNNLYYGDINEAIFDQEFKRLDINKLRKYDPNRISSAYITSTGSYESDFEKAKRSFVNQGLVRYFYLDNEGKLHYDFDNAKQSNINNIKVDEIVYYKIKDVNGQEFKINPLNKDDINLFKKIAIEHLKEGNAKDFDLKIFSKNNTNQKLNEEAYKLNGELTSFVSLINNQDNIFNTIENVINEIIRTSKTLRYDFKMSLTGNQRNNYKFQWWNNEQGERFDVWNNRNLKDSNSPQIEINKNNDKELIFRNFSIEEIEGLLNRFANRINFTKNSKAIYSDQFLKNNLVEQHGAANVRIAEECYWYINLNNSKNNKNQYAIHFNYIGKDGGGANGVDIQILKDGAQNGGVGFKMELIEKGGTSSENIETQYTNMIFNEVETKLSSANLGVSDDIRDLLVNGILEVVTKDENGKDVSLLKYAIKKQITKKYLIERALKGNPKYGFKEFDIKNTIIDPIKDENYSISIDTNQKNNAYNKMLNYIKENSQTVIYYKGFPIFEFDKNLLSENKINKENMSEFLWFNLLNLNIQKNDYSQIINISILNNLTQNSYIKNNEFIVSTNEKNMINIPSSKLNMNGTLNKNNETNEKTYYDLWYAFNAYNKNLGNYLRRNNNLIENISEELIDINNILFLRNGTGDINDEHSSLPLYYANHLGLKNDFNEQIGSLVESKFAYDEIVLKNIKEASGSINPSKVVILYNISGEIMNPGVKLDDDLALVTSSDAIFDLEQNLLDNVMRTLLVQKAKDRFFYLNDDGTKTLVKNKVNQIYTLNWRGNDYHFATFNDAKRYLNSIVELLSTRVEM